MKFASFLFFFTGVWKSFVKWIALVPAGSGGRTRKRSIEHVKEEYRTCQRMPLGSFSRYMAEKHYGNGMDNVVVGSKYTH